MFRHSLRILPCRVQPSGVQVSDHISRTIDDSLPNQGDTLKTDLVIPGTKIYSDATWKTKKVPEMAAATTT
jgi:hypothetical protein